MGNAATRLIAQVDSVVLDWLADGASAMRGMNDALRADIRSHETPFSAADEDGDSRRFCRRGMGPKQDGSHVVC